MTPWIERPLKALLRLPEPPRLASAGVSVVNPAPAYFGYSFFAWGRKQVAALAGLVFGFNFVQEIDALQQFSWVVIPLEVMSWLGFATQLVVTLLALRLEYEQCWYVFTDRSLRVRQGVWRVDEQTVTFANVQNLLVRQGPLQRLFGIADLEVASAGGGSPWEQKQGEDAAHTSVVKLRGLADAPAIRERILAHLRQRQDSGLGDPDDARSPRAEAGPTSPQTLLAARELLAEARALRQALSGAV